MSVVSGAALGPRHVDRADVVVVGSGTGGAVVAKILAEADVDVVVLEEGPHVRPEEYGAFRPTETLRRLGREAGTSAVVGLGDTPLITVMTGRAIGGSSTLTGGVCFRIPEPVLDRWVRERGLDRLSARELQPAFESAEREAHVSYVRPELFSRATQRFVDGATKLGIPVHPLRRNVTDCAGLARCNFGCPNQSKWSVDRTYLPKAMRAGARVQSDSMATRILTSGGRVSGVAGELLTTDDRGVRTVGAFTIHASTVVLACGAVHTPQLMMASRVRSPHLGGHLTLHPSLRVVARFDDRLDGWKGALQSAYVDAFEDERLMLVGLFAPPNVLAATLPGVGPTFAERLRNIGQLAAFGALVHDEDGGRIRRGIGREPMITYRLDPRDKQAMIRGIHALSEIFFAAGAREVYPPVFGLPPLTSHDEVLARIDERISARRLECVTFHPLGTVRMARSAAEGVVDQGGECFELPGLFVADGSVFPSSIGVNSQLPIMAMSTRIAWELAERLRSRRRKHV